MQSVIAVAYQSRMSEDSRSERESEFDEESSNDQNNGENIFVYF